MKGLRHPRRLQGILQWTMVEKKKTSGSSLEGGSSPLTSLLLRRLSGWRATVLRGSGRAWEWTEWGRCWILDLYFAGQLTAFGCTHWLIITLQWEKNTSHHALAMFARCHVVGYVPFVSTVFIIQFNSMSFLDVHWASAVFIHVHLCSYRTLPFP